MDLDLNPRPLYNFNSKDFKDVDYHAWSEELDAELAKLAQLRDLQGPATPEQRDGVLRQLLALQQPDGSFPVGLGYWQGMNFDESGIEEGDVIDYVYDPTYLACQVLIRAMLDGAEYPGLREALDRGLAFSCGRALKGASEYWENNISSQIENLHNFARAGLHVLEGQDLDLCPEFMWMVDDIFIDYQVMLDQAATIPTDEYAGVTFALMEAMAAWGCVPYIALFVYGSLTAGMPNAHVMSNCLYLGRAIADGYRLYDTQPFPMVNDCLEFHHELASYDEKRGPRGPVEQVMGELYLCTVADLRRIHKVLGITNPDDDLSGSPYVLDVADVAYTEDSGFSVFSLTTHVQRVYLYTGLKGEAGQAVPLQLQPYSRFAALKKTHVWYAACGAEAKLADFMRLVAACDDPTPPVDDCHKCVPFPLVADVAHEVFNEQYVQAAAQEGWLDTTAYLVTRSQAAQIARMRGFDVTFDADCPCVCDLGIEAGIPVYGVAAPNRVEQAKEALAAAAQAQPDLTRLFLEMGFTPVVKDADGTEHEVAPSRLDAYRRDGYEPHALFDSALVTRLQ